MMNPARSGRLSRVRSFGFSIATLASILLAACDRKNEAPTSPLTPRAATHSLYPSVKGSKRHRADEAGFVALGKQSASFGGYFLDGRGALVAYVADSAEFGPVRQAMNQLLASRALGLSPRDMPSHIEIRKGDFSFQQLSDWRDIVTDSLLNQPGVKFDDLDEARNRVTIGISKIGSSTISAQLLPMLTRLGIPSSAVYFQPTGSPVEATGTLTFPADTGGGGIEMDMHTQSGSYFANCSLGFVADSVGTSTFFTASHCTDHEYSLDYATAYMHSPSGSVQIGTESGDPVPEGYMCHGPFNMYCDWSSRSTDAAIFHMATGSHLRRGLLPRPKERVSGRIGSDSIDVTNPWLYITGTGTAVSGGTVDHIGYASGWNYGTITNTCADFATPNDHQQATFGAFCQMKSDFYVHPGDSGGPVFNWDGRDGVVLYGLTVGADSISSGYENGYFSSYTEILSDFGFGAGVIDPTTGTILGTMTSSGSFDLSTPVITWSTPSVTNGSSSATTYTVYRSTFDGSSNSYTEIDNPIATQIGGSSWEDADVAATQYDGGTRPPPRTSWVSYRVVAYNTGVTSEAGTIYFKTS